MELSTYLSSLNQAVLDLDEAINKIKDSLQIDDAVEILVALSRHKDEIKVVYDEIALIVGQLMEQQGEIIAGDGTKIEKKGDVSRTGWKHKDLADAVIARLSEMAIDTSTGEIMMDAPQMAKKMLDFIQPSYWRIKELGSLGINADDFSKVGEYKESIIVRKAKP